MNAVVECVEAVEVAPEVLEDVKGADAPSPSRRISESWAKSARQLVHVGDVLDVRGLGLCRFRYSVILPNGKTYIEVVHPERGFHAVWPERVRRVSRKALRPAKAA